MDEVRIEEIPYQQLQYTELSNSIPLVAAFIDNIKPIVSCLEDTKKVWTTLAFK